MMYLDTHAVVWLYYGKLSVFPKGCLDRLEKENLLVSPAVILELQFLKEIKRIDDDPMQIFQTLEESINLQQCQADFSKVVMGALSQTWTRDPFDRIITAQASIQSAPLLTKDRTILRHYSLACWK